MKELSLNILDITENSVKAGASLTEILIEETASTLTIAIKDDGCGMSEDVVKRVTDPFYTTRTTRSVGLGIPLFKLAAEMTDGSFEITSKEKSLYPDGHGTVTKASFNKDHIDFTPLGDVAATLTTLIQGHPETDFYFSHKYEGVGEVTLDTRELREILGNEVSLGEYEVIKWIEGFLSEQYQSLEI